jgi:hypothetical protein
MSVVLLLAAAALADDPPPPAPEKPATTDITVSAKRPELVQRIDRRVYTIPTDAKSAVEDGYALLRGLPAITVGLDNTVMLLGSANVTILVDNKLPPAGDKVLGTLRGEDIDHIEVMTNPSAEYSPDGTGGIINIVLKKTHRQGTTGSVIASVDSLGTVEAEATHKLVTGAWSISTTLRFTRLNSRESSSTLLAVENAPGDTPTIDLQSYYRRSHNWFGMISEEIGYQVDDKTSVTFDAWYGLNRGTRTDTYVYTGLTPDFESFNQLSDRTYQNGFGGVELAIDRQGSAPGESLKLDSYFVLSDDRYVQDNGLLFPAAIGNATYVNTSVERETYATGKVDYVHPMPGGRILSLGASDDLRILRLAKALDSGGAVAEVGPGYVYAMTGTRNVSAAYASLQQPIGPWTLLPTLRFELVNFSGNPVSLPSFSTHTANFYPSVHLSRTLSSRADLNLSYARRTDRPLLGQLNPFTVLTSTTSVNAGNPDLKNQTTDAYEANLSWHRQSVTGTIIVYDRETADVWSNAYTVTSAGLTETQLINAGHKSDRGAEFDLNTPLGTRMKMTTSVNLFDSRVPIDPSLGVGDSNEFRYTGTATLDWSAATQAGKPGDSVQAQCTYQSPQQTYQLRQGPLFTPSLSYSHTLAKKLSIVLKVENAFGVQHNRQDVDAPLTQAVTDARTIGPKFAIKIVKNFGS